MSEIPQTECHGPSRTSKRETARQCIALFRQLGKVETLMKFPARKQEFDEISTTKSYPCLILVSLNIRQVTGNSTCDLPSKESAPREGMVRTGY
jgi:hypothetical protein